jgi:hypothetical protein
MDIQDLRPVEIELHPLCNQKYLIPTFSIGETYAMVMRVIRRRDSGLVIWGQTRYGKTSAVKYCAKSLGIDFPNFPISIYNARLDIAPKKGDFYTQLLEVVGHARWEDKCSVAVKHARLVNFMAAAASADARMVYIVFLDEAQRMEQCHFNWVKDIYNDLMDKGVILLPILVGLKQLIDQKKAFLKSGEEGEAVVNRFMLYEHPFRGIREKVDFQTSLGFYDIATYPPDSDWSYTRFFLPQAYANGFRLASIGDVLWDAFNESYAGLNLLSKMEIPMKYYTSTIELLFQDNVNNDRPDFTISKDACLRTIKESWFLAATKNLQSAKSLK